MDLGKQKEFQTKEIETLIPDVEDLLVKGVQEIDPALLEDFSKEVASVVSESLNKREPRATLRMSNVGKPCTRELWYSINKPELGEPMRAESYFKFLYGHLIEALMIFLAKLAGHRVEGQQDEADIEGVKGHRDVVIDGVLTDAKSASSYSFRKFKEGRLKEDDPFGYIDQIGSYLEDAQDDPLVTDKSRAAFWVADKTLGHMTLDVHEKSKKDYREFIRQRKAIVNQPNPPERYFDDIPEGKSGNMKLGINCSYCAFKHECWPGLRTFLYSNGPVYLTKVVREPNVMEITNKEKEENSPKDRQENGQE